MYIIILAVLPVCMHLCSFYPSCIHFPAPFTLFTSALPPLPNHSLLFSPLTPPPPPLLCFSSFLVTQAEMNSLYTLPNSLAAPLRAVSCVIFKSWKNQKHQLCPCTHALHSASAAIFAYFQTFCAVIRILMELAFSDLA